MMHSSRYTFCFFVALLLFSLTATEINACTCAGDRPACEAYGEASAVFVGVVTGDSTIPLKLGDHMYQQRLLSFVIDSAFRGAQGGVTEVITGMGGGDCGFAFKRGERYLVYANTDPEDKRLHTTICSRTRLLSEAGEDLEYIRGLSSAVPGALIYGEAQRYRSDGDSGPQQTPMAGLKINIEGEEKQVEARTDTKGHFSVGGLPPGVYKLKISLPTGLTSSSAEQEIRVADRGCAKVHFGVMSDGRLSGRVLDFDGRPVPKAEIYLCKPGEKWFGSAGEIAYSDQDGLYDFKALPPGQYALGVRFDGLTRQNRPFPHFYYPGVDNIDQARIVSLGDGERIEKYDLVLPPPPAERTVNGVVLWTDGKPIPNARIEYSQVNVPIVYGANPDQEGRFSFKVYDGLKIMMRATVEIDNGKYIYSDYVEASVTGEDVKVRIVVPVNR